MSPVRVRLLLLTLLSLLFAGERRGGAGSSSPVRGVSATLAKLPIRFEANAGQHDPDVRYLARRGTATLALRDDGASLTLLDGGARPVVLGLHVDGGRSVEPQGEEPLATKTSYFVGSAPSKWRTGIPSYARVTYPSVLRGVDLVFHGENGALEYDFVVAPGAGVAPIALDVEGGGELSISDRGELRIATERGLVVMPPPLTYQRDGTGARHAIASSYRLVGPRKVGFEVSAYDRKLPLVIDPVIDYATYLGTAADDAVSAIAVDGLGATYVAGHTVPGGAADTFVAKLSPNGTQLEYTAFFGGSADDRATAIAVGGDGTAYVTGTTSSSDLPQVNAVNAFRGGQDGYVFRLTAAGDALAYSTYLSGSDEDTPTGVAIDASGIFVGGSTRSTDLGGPPGTAGGRGHRDAFVVKLTPAGNAVSWVTYLGGTGDENVRGFGLDATGRAYVAGVTSSGADFPQTATPLKASCQGSGRTDAFVARVAASGTAFDLATCLGGSSDDEATAIAVEPDGQLYVTGSTRSDDFPSVGSVSTHSGGSDAFVTKLDGSFITYSRLLGGEGDDVANAIAVDPAHTVWITGSTRSSTFPTVAAVQETLAGYTDAFVTRVNAAGSSLIFSSYYGGANEIDEGTAIAVGEGTVFVAGVTAASDLPVIGALQATSGGGQEGFVTQLGTPALLVSPAIVVLEATSTRQFTAVGGAGSGYVFALDANGSGATITSDGVYTAGVVVGTDVVRVTDAVGATASATVHVVAKDAPPAGSPLTISPPSANVPPRGQRGFLAGGGVAPYTFGFVSNASGASLGANGLYFAGANGGLVDTIRVTDSVGAFATATIAVGAKVAIAPEAASVPPNGRIAFSASGGGGSGYSWSLSTNGSAGTIDPVTGQYKAGSGSSTVDTVEVKDALGNTASVNVSVGGGLALSPAAAATTTRGTVKFSAAGGSGLYTWALRSAPSGGTIDATTGTYVAGNTGDTIDAVEATDSLGNRATVSVTVGPGLTITPSSGTVVSGTRLPFTAAGGSGEGYAFGFVTNASGAKLGSDGIYTAGTNAGTDLVRLTDSLGSSVEAKVVVVTGSVPANLPDAGVGSNGRGSGSDGLNLGGGGCATTGGEPRSPSGAAMLAVVALVLFRRRRR